MRMLYMQRCKRQYLGPLPIAKLSADNAGQSSTNRISVLVDEDAGVVVEFDEASIFALLFLSRSDHHSVPDVSSPYFVRDSNAGPA